MYSGRRTDVAVRTLKRWADNAASSNDAVLSAGLPNKKLVSDIRLIGLQFVGRTGAVKTEIRRGPVFARVGV